MSRWPLNRRCSRAAAGMVALAASACSCGAWAADDRVEDAPEESQPAEIVRFGPVGRQPLVGLGRIAEHDLGSLFDQQVFGRSREVRRIVGGDQVVVEAASTPEEGVLDKLEDLRRRGESRIESLDKVCGLSPEQRQPLELALASDLRRVAGEIDAIRRTYLGQRIARQRLALEQERLQALHQDAVRCRGLMEQAFREGSLVASVGIGVLEPDQRRRLADWVAGRRATRWEAMVRLVLDQLDEAGLGLSSRQHEALCGQLRGDVPPLAVFADDRFTRDPTGLQSVLVLARLGRIGEPVVRPLLDPRQWAELERRIVQAGDPEAVERMLVEQGILEPAGEEVLAGEEVP